jgi:uncharacterized protein
MEPSILTRSGGLFNFNDPKISTIYIEDIAHALSQICRFTGHTSKFYSVAQHSVLVSYQVPPDFALQGLLHDATEAYLGDVSSPLKHLLNDYKRIEQRIEQIVLGAFGIEGPLHPSVKHADLQLLKTEQRDLMGVPEQYLYMQDGIYPLACVIEPLDCAQAKEQFLQRYTELAQIQQRRQFEDSLQASLPLDIATA